MILQNGSCFTLSTKHSSYQLWVDEDGHLRHTWYGAPLAGESLASRRELHGDHGIWPNLIPTELGTPGLGDHRTPAVIPEYEDGSECADLLFRHAEIENGKPDLGMLPMFRAAEKVQTLRVYLQDSAGLEAEIRYSVYEDFDLITRSVCYRNGGSAPLCLQKAASLSMDFNAQPMELLTLNGRWAHERYPERIPISGGLHSVGSTQGIPAHPHNPAAALLRPGTTEESGECWGFAFVYSGNFLIEAERSEGGIRFVMGIHPYHFHWLLKPGEAFQTPEAAMIYSECGLGEMSRRFHRAIRSLLLPEKWADAKKPRPVLINSWEGFFFDFDAARLLELAKSASQAGCDLLVLDDGWFKGRKDTTTSQGDWESDPDKLPEGLPGMCSRLAELGMRMGIWLEPEAISRNSDLYRKHPDWAIEIPGRKAIEIRDELLLDLTRNEVVDGVWQKIKAVLESCPIAYLKWDMNRAITGAYSLSLPAKEQGQFFHRYVLGLYELQRRVRDCFPELLFENCAGGGARFDCGMLSFSPQIWCSDNTDPYDRIPITLGTSLFYPLGCMGSHFGASPNPNSGRNVTVEERMVCALAGTFGYELDMRHMSPEELQKLRPWAEWFRQHGSLIREGDLYRLLPCEGNTSGAAWMLVSQNQEEAAVFVLGGALEGEHGHNHLPSPDRRLPLPGLLQNGTYTDERGNEWPAAVLRCLGLPLPDPRECGGAWLCLLTKQ